MSEQPASPTLPDPVKFIKQEPFFRVRLGETGPDLTGTPSARLGQVNLPTPLQTGRDVYAEWQWNGQEVVVRNCRLGFFPIYYYATDKVFGVSPAIEQLLAHGAPADLDDAAMAVYLRLGWTLGEDTVFRHIRALPPGGTVRWSGGQARVSGGFSHPARLNITRDAAIDAFAELVRQAVRRRASKEVPFVLPLSGGRDSRNIFLELCDQDCKPQVCVTNHDFPPYRTKNIEIARQLAQRFDIPHQSLGQPGSRLSTELRKNRLNNYCATENIWCVSLYAEIARRYDKPVIYEGGPDGVYYGGYCDDETQILFEQGHTEDIARRLINRWHNWQSSEDALLRVLTPEAAARFPLDLAIERLRRELDRYLDAPNPQASFYFWERGRRVAALQPFSIARQAGVTAVTPYLDHDLLDFLAALPKEVTLDKASHDAAIHRTYPALKDIPFESKAGAPPPSKAISITGGSSWKVWPTSVPMAAGDSCNGAPCCAGSRHWPFPAATCACA